MAKTILIVDDEPSVIKGLRFNLEQQEGYVVDAATDGEAALELFEPEKYDLVLLDLMLPKLDGMEVCQRIRAVSDVPIIMLTAKGEDIDKIMGLEYGADDYMTKPFSPAALMAHLRALTRRQGAMIFESIDVGDLALKLESHDLTCAEKSIHLRKREFSLAKVLFANKGRIVSKEALIDKVWGPDSNADDNNVEAYISFLRKKLRFLESTTTIETVRRVGYRLSPPESAAKGADLPLRQ